MLSRLLIFLSLSISFVFNSPTTANYKPLCVYTVYRKSLGCLYTLYLLLWITRTAHFFLCSVSPSPRRGNHILKRFVLCYLYLLNIRMIQSYRRENQISLKIIRVDRRITNEMKTATFCLTLDLYLTNPSVSRLYSMIHSNCDSPY